MTENDAKVDCQEWYRNGLNLVHVMAGNGMPKCRKVENGKAENRGLMTKNDDRKKPKVL